MAAAGKKTARHLGGGSRYQDVPNNDDASDRDEDTNDIGDDADNDSTDLERNGNDASEVEISESTSGESVQLLEGQSTNQQQRRQRQRTRNVSRREAHGSSFMMLLIWCLMFLCLVIAVIGLMGYRYYRKPQHHLPSVKSWFTSSESDGDGEDEEKVTKVVTGIIPADTSPGKVDTLGTSEENATANETAAPYTHPNAQHLHRVHYDPEAPLPNFDPFELASADANEPYASNFVPPRLFDNAHWYDDAGSDANWLGYLRFPTVHNNTIVFCAEGDLYLTHVQDGYSRLASAKLTTTDGNALSPHINPVYPYYLAFTATYAVRREVYLLDLRGPRTPAIRLTYWDSGAGVSSVVGWAPDGKSILVRAMSNDVSLPDYRLYRVHLSQTDSKSFVAAPQIQPVPLSQAMDGTMVGSCIYFVRVSQSSHTIRYVGGTAEKLWLYCDDEEASRPDSKEYSLAVPVFSDDYPGTSKSPQLYRLSDGKSYMFFLSDRGYNNDKTEWIPERMNVWALPIDENAPSSQSVSDSMSKLIRITDASCDFEGRTIREFAVDVVTGNVVVRIGSDLYHLRASKIRAHLEQRRHLEADSPESESEKEDVYHSGETDYQSEESGEEFDDNGISDEADSENETPSDESGQDSSPQDKENTDTGINPDGIQESYEGETIESSSEQVESSNFAAGETGADGNAEATGEDQNTSSATTSSSSTVESNEAIKGSTSAVNQSAETESATISGATSATPATDPQQNASFQSTTTAGTASTEAASDPVSETNNAIPGEESSLEEAKTPPAAGTESTIPIASNQPPTNSSDGDQFQTETGVASTSPAVNLQQPASVQDESNTSAFPIEATSEVVSESGDSVQAEQQSAKPTGTISANTKATGSAASNQNPANSIIEGQNESKVPSATESLPLNQTALVVEESPESVQSETEPGVPEAPKITEKDHQKAVQELGTLHDQLSYSASRTKESTIDHHSGHSVELERLPIVVHSDFSQHQERVVPVSVPKHIRSMDVYETAVGTFHALMSVRGQLWVAPVIDKKQGSFGGSGNIPERRYRLGPGAMMGGSARILNAVHVPNPLEDSISDRRLAVVLATDPKSPTAEHAFFLTETQHDATPLFLDLDHLPTPFLGGHISGGNTKDGGLGSIRESSVKVSPCGRRMAWTDTDGRIGVMTLPQYQNMSQGEPANYTVLPQVNELGESMMGDEVDLSWSPGGRYLAVNHNARNQFMVISIVDCGEPYDDDAGLVDINIGRIVQATPDRFNCESMIWGKSPSDLHEAKEAEMVGKITGGKPPKDVPATVLYFLSDRDIMNDARSPWGTRAPAPHFPKRKAIYGIPLVPKETKTIGGHFTGGGAAEMTVDKVLKMKRAIIAKSTAQPDGRRKLLSSLVKGFKALSSKRRERSAKSLEEPKLDEIIAEKVDVNAIKEEMKEPLEKLNIDESASFPVDMDIDFGPKDLSLGRTAYRIGIPTADYIELISQTSDDGSFLLAERVGDQKILHIFVAEDFPSDQYESTPVEIPVGSVGRSTSLQYIFIEYGIQKVFKIVPNTVPGLSSILVDKEVKKDLVDTDGLSLSIWPSLEYRQLFADAWRMLRDYFYDPDMTGVDWPAMYDRYVPLVSRCTKREELDDVLEQMASETSALHTFVYGGEYNSPTHGDIDILQSNQIGSLGAVLERSADHNGYKVVSIPERDPDFDVVDGKNIYSPLSDQMLRLSGQRGLKAGDIIVGINGESVMRVPDIHILLRGSAGRSVRLEVIRLASGLNDTDANIDANDGGSGEDDGARKVEPLVTVPVSSAQAENLRYTAWESKTRLEAKQLAKDAGFTVGYIHLRDMSGDEAENAFARGFFPDYNAQAMILDNRHNRGGNIDSWILDVLQRRAWSYWQSRDFTTSNGGLGWDEQFAFRGHIVVLIDEKTSSDGEGVSRGISELGLGKLVGTRTWGGGIWLASDNHLVDGGIATAPEIGTYNDNFGWGLGVEMTGVSPDIEVDNNPRSTFAGKDEQLERAIVELKSWLEKEPVVLPRPPAKKKDVSLGERECRANN